MSKISLPNQLQLVAAQIRKEMLPERLQFTLQLHADLDVMKAGTVGSDGVDNVLTSKLLSYS